jgi:hypothetical protein
MIGTLLGEAIGQPRRGDRGVRLTYALLLVVMATAASARDEHSAGMAVSLPTAGVVGPWSRTGLGGIHHRSPGAASYGFLRVSHSDGATVKGPHEFFFTRGIYSGGGGDEDWGARWAVDYPKADLQFLTALRRLSIVDAYERDNALVLDDPELRRFPFLYILEVGSMSLSDAEARGLREYLQAGGFLVVDDFWGSWAWANFESEMKRVLPDRRIVDVPLDHPVFHVFYDIASIIQVPNVYQGIFSVSGGPTHEYDGYVPRVRGIFDDDGRLMVLINWNTDLGDAWEWADDPQYPLKFSTFAYEMGINFVIYAMSH